MKIKNNIQAVILAAGQSSRFSPFRYYDHKSLIRIAGKPIIIHTIESIKKSGIADIIIVVSSNSQIKKLLGSGKNLGVKIRYVVQKEPTGAGNGLLLAKNYIRDNFFLLNASRVDFCEFKDLMISRKTPKNKGVLLVKKEINLEKFGVLKIKRDRVLDIIEKPSKGAEPSNLRLIGIYLFSKDFLRVLRQTIDEHYRLEKAISKFTKEGIVNFVKTDKDAPSLKYIWDILGIKNFLLQDMNALRGENIQIAKSAEIIGKVMLGDNAVIMEGVKIKGPCFIGKNVTIGNNTILRGGVDIEDNCVVGANMEVKNSLIMGGTRVHSGFIGDSIIGENVRIGAGFLTANVRLDRKNIESVINNIKMDTGINHLGAIIGKNVHIGIKSSTMPGVIIEKNATVGPLTVVLNNVPPDTKYYTKFQEVVIKK